MHIFLTLVLFLAGFHGLGFRHTTPVNRGILPTITAPATPIPHPTVNP